MEFGNLPLLPRVVAAELDRKKCRDAACGIKARPGVEEERARSPRQDVLHRSGGFVRAAQTT